MSSYLAIRSSQCFSRGLLSMIGVVSKRHRSVAGASSFFVVPPTPAFSSLPPGAFPQGFGPGDFFA